MRCSAARLGAQCCLLAVALVALSVGKAGAFDWSGYVVTSLSSAYGVVASDFDRNGACDSIVLARSAGGTGHDDVFVNNFGEGRAVGALRAAP